LCEAIPLDSDFLSVEHGRKQRGGLTVQPLGRTYQDDPSVGIGEEPAFDDWPAGTQCRREIEAADQPVGRRMDRHAADRRADERCKSLKPRVTNWIGRSLHNDAAQSDGVGGKKRRRAGGIRGSRRWFLEHDVRPRMAPRAHVRSARSIRSHRADCGVAGGAGRMERLPSTDRCRLGDCPGTPPKRAPRG
jgi:hypothetical protein